VTAIVGASSARAALPGVQADRSAAIHEKISKKQKRLKVTFAWVVQ
jgi:hypothetical protein